MNEQSGVVLVTGSSGFIGRALVEKLALKYRVVGLDLHPPKELPSSAEFEEVNLTSDDSIKGALDRIRQRHGRHIASVIHLAAYFDLSGKANPKYDEITVRGTKRLLQALRDFDVEQFVFASTMLVHRATQPGGRITEETPIEPELPYRNSKIQTERLLHKEHGSVPVVYLRPAGVYDDRASNPFLANQIARIYERDPTARVYPGDLRTGQSFLHLEDFADAVLRLVARRKELPAELPLLLGGPEAIGYGELQREVGRLIHGEAWETWEVPNALAKAGSWVQNDVLGEDSFIRPWMVDVADDHYELDITRARTLLDWEPKHSLRETLPRIIERLKSDPSSWYRANKLDAARVAGQGEKAHERTETLRAEQHKMMPGHMGDMTAMHRHMLWTHFLVIALGAWLLTSPFQFALRNALTGWSDIICGVLLMLFGTLALSPRFASAQWGTTVVGLWLLFAPLFLDSERRRLRQRHDRRCACHRLLGARADDAGHES